MSKESTLLAIGVLVLVSPYLGLPMEWLEIVLPVLGAIVILISHLLRKERIAAHAASTPQPVVPPQDTPSPIA